LHSRTTEWISPTGLPPIFTTKFGKAAPAILVDFPNPPHNRRSIRKPESDEPGMIHPRSATIGLLLLALLTAACTPAPGAPVAAPTSRPSPTSEPSATRTAAITLTITPLPTTTLLEYPNILLPGIDRLQEIFRTGDQGGMRRGVFSKVGDSITANGFFLVPFGLGDYSLGEYAYLQDVIRFYLTENAGEANSFVHDSFAARTSWRAEHVLDPAKTRAPCPAGESPLACEFRIVQPAVTVIMLGTNDVMAGTGIGNYEETLRKIILFSLNRGSIPILTTLPVLTGKDADPYNTVIRDLAARWEIPLIDLSAALAALPHQGVGPDGIHLSWVEPAIFEAPYLRHGLTVRNLLTLQALNAVGRSFPPDA
jgi:hypothetical protein